MITTCTECQARYQLDDEKIPRRKIQVRCPACSGVFALDGTQAGVAMVDQDLTPEPVVAPSPAPAASTDEFVTTNDFEQTYTPEPEPVAAPVSAPEVPAAAAPTAVADVAPAAESPVAVDTTPEAVQAPVAVLDKVVESKEKPRRRRSKEEMLARALVSDILVYNRELRDNALAEGNLLEALGAEIKKSWELYKEKVTPEVANSTNHFREALNEILAEGDKVF